MNPVVFFYGSHVLSGAAVFAAESKDLSILRSRHCFWERRGLFFSLRANERGNWGEKFGANKLTFRLRQDILRREAVLNSNLNLLHATIII